MTMPDRIQITYQPKTMATPDFRALCAELLEAWQFGDDIAGPMNRARAALKRYRLADRWALGAAAPSLELLEADRDKLDKRLKLGWLLTTPEAMALIPGHDQQRLAALDADGRPFAPDRLRVALAPKLAPLQALGLPQLLGRFAAGETIAATDPDLIALHGHAIAYKRDLAAATLPSPAAKPTGTLRALLAAVGWKLQKVGRIKARGGGRDTYTYRADRVALPAGVDALALAAAWLEALRRPALPESEEEGLNAADLLPVEPPQIFTTMAMQFRSAWREGVEDGWNEARAVLARGGHPPAAAPAPGENLATPPAPEPGDVARPTYLDAIRLAEGCHDYSGGHSGPEGEAWHGAIDTVVDVLKRAAVGPWDSQTRAVFGVGAEAQAGEVEA